jgi:hypothetical protein
MEPRGVYAQFARVYPENTRGLIEHSHSYFPKDLVTRLGGDVVAHHHVVALCDVSRDTKRLAAYTIPRGTREHWTGIQRRTICE